ncbi:Clavaminate synthase-like protein [Cutaneotrichosporon oleaginosum]|uniref:Clavaminate synthase-like protein n=1 Tax=Cutaneotrichosporon oleaginosum TaxID=879819 RepID=A0A0J0XKS5_9TREE|nr:Clavaminate synthase-like protein [Cutaneotrichosporon oleaginosum]KLT41701.1 Clavaminate synthase-like protein [Cutaneotrichosporon oleaginosum]TXT08073.1 hypothetical protein COLE_04997 [Cutaneotrichosporon oleaginosum]
MATTTATLPPTLVAPDNSQELAFEPFALPATNQRELGAPHPPGTVTPLALRPSAPTTLDEAVAHIRSLQTNNTLTSLLATHGALLFRGLPIKNAHDFSAFAHAFGFAPHEIVGIVVERGLLAPNVAPANESPPHVTIYNHNESPQVPHAPGYIFFYGHRAPAEGGETPISSSAELYVRARAEVPQLVDDLERLGVLSTVRYRPEAQYQGGSTLREAFGKEWADGDSDEVKRQKVEDQIRRYGRDGHTTWTWAEDGGLEVRHVIPVLRRQVGTNLPVLFTQLASVYVRTLAGEATSRITTVSYGDGTPIPAEYLAKLKEITDDIRVLHRWREGDVLVYDNVLAQHGREPWKGEQADRVVLASLFDGAIPGPYGDKPWEQLVALRD